MKVFVILVCCLVNNVASVQEKRYMESPQNGTSSYFSRQISNHLNRLDAKTGQIQKKNYVMNAKKSVSECPYFRGVLENVWTNYGSGWYRFGFNKITWQEAKMVCKSLNGYLVKIDSSAENRWLGSVFRNTGRNDRSLWIGANDLKRERMWTWISHHGTLAYSKWTIGEPNNQFGGEHCGEIYRQCSPTWNDVPCDQKRGYICEYW